MNIPLDIYSNLSFSTCPHATDEELYHLINLNFLLEGVLQFIISCLGVAGNTISIFLLLGRQLKNSFNKLLAILAVFDLIYLVTMMLDSMSKLGLHILIFPHFLHIGILTPVQVWLKFAFEPSLTKHSYYESKSDIIRFCKQFPVCVKLSGSGQRLQHMHKKHLFAGSCHHTCAILCSTRRVVHSDFRMWWDLSPPIVGGLMGGDKGPMGGYWRVIRDK